MKKLLVPLLLTLLLVLLLPTACAEEAYAAAQQSLYTIVLRTETGDVPLGSGVVFLRPDQILTAQSCLQQGDLYAIGADGEFPVAQQYDLSDSGAAVLRLKGGTSALPLQYSDYSHMALPMLLSVDASGRATFAPLFQAVYSSYRGLDALMLSSSEGLLPGGAMIDESGALMALVVSRKAEGEGMYTALTSSSLQRMMNAGLGDPAFLDVHCEWKGGMLTVSWEDQGHADGLYLLTISGAENTYYTTYTTQPDVHFMSIAVAPGHTYNLQVQWTKTREDAHGPTWSEMTRFTVPAGRFGAFGFAQSCHLAVTDQNPDLITHVLPEARGLFVAELQAEERTFVLQLVNRYDVDAQIEMPLVVELIAPDGQFYAQQLGYAFLPEYEENDVFCIALTEQLADCSAFSRGGLQPGEYTLRYAIGGLTAGECRFTLQ